ncbi:hypothetical protein RM844_18815 [Streptomyces sp. DSM 44915]|uniref:Integral membrane protein n=1 Tax=Streptomyces chisholmiae TaxID=3075540 RepID=A0ABU2JTM9_9ACTN|nr:hypothetical protein [Streptomyces sp. DSM 44915]MDT0268338.1 hypothetical protein [Streptomyces sp. DSM 44915]
MSATRTTRRGAARRAGESAFGALLLGRIALAALLTAALLAGGAWASWDTVRHLIGSGAEQGSVTLLRCERDGCTGVFTPPGETVVLEQRLARGADDTFDAVRLPDGTEVVRSDTAGALYAVAPFSGALLLGAVVVAGGLRRYRVAWIMAGLALAHLLVTFLLWI